MSPRNESVSRSADHRVVTDITAYQGLSVADREAVRQQAIEKIISLVPAGQRAEARRFLADRDKARGYSGSSDPEVARQLSILASLARLDAREALETVQPRLTHSRELSKRRVKVLIALVPSLEGDQTRATVVRKAGEAREALVLLRESDATANDLSIAMRAVRASFGRRPNPLRADLKFHIRAGDSGVGPNPHEQSIKSLQFLRLQKAAPIVGIGTVRSIVSLVLPPASP